MFVRIHERMNEPNRGPRFDALAFDAHFNPDGNLLIHVVNGPNGPLPGCAKTVLVSEKLVRGLLVNRGSKFTINQNFAEGFDPGKAAPVDPVTPSPPVGDTDADMLWKAMGGQGKPPIEERVAALKALHQEVKQLRGEVKSGRNFREYVRRNSQLVGSSWGDVQQEYDSLAAFVNKHGNLESPSHPGFRRRVPLLSPVSVAGVKDAAFRVVGVRDVEVLADPDLPGNAIVMVKLHHGADPSVIKAVNTEVQATKAAGCTVEVVSFNMLWELLKGPAGSLDRELQLRSRTVHEDRILQVLGVRRAQVIQGVGRVLALIETHEGADLDAIRYNAFHAAVDSFGDGVVKLRVHTFDEVWDMIGHPAVTPMPTSEDHRILSAAQRMYPDAKIDEGAVVRLLVEGQTAAKDLSDLQVVLLRARAAVLTAMEKDPEDPAYNGLHLFHAIERLIAAFTSTRDGAKNWQMVKNALAVVTPVDAVQAFAKQETDLTTLRLQADRLLANTVEVYTERARMVASLAGLAMFLGESVGLGEHDPADTNWDPEWRTIVFVDLPDGNGGVLQASWHISDSDRHLVQHLPKYEGAWDGHTTSQKYERMAAAADPTAWEIVLGRTVKRKAGDRLTVDTVRQEAWHLLIDAMALEVAQ